MPITQNRMLNILDELDRLKRWTDVLRADLIAILHSPMSGEAKLEAVSALLEQPIPACVQSAIEQDHFRRTKRRNEKSARRMQLKRQGEPHGLGSENRTD